jgi:hypothetical protein
LSVTCSLPANAANNAHEIDVTDTLAGGAQIQDCVLRPSRRFRKFNLQQFAGSPSFPFANPAFCSLRDTRGSYSQPLILLAVNEVRPVIESSSGRATEQYSAWRRRPG